MFSCRMKGSYCFMTSITEINISGFLLCFFNCAGYIEKKINKAAILIEMNKDVLFIKNLLLAFTILVSKIIKSQDYLMLNESFYD